MTANRKLGVMLLLVVIAIAGCVHNRPSMVDQYRARHGWGAPVDTFGPYMITSKFKIKKNTDSTFSSDSISLVGFLKGDVCRKRLDTKMKEMIPRLVIDSVCLVTNNPEQNACFSLNTTPATYDSIAPFLYEGLRSTLSDVSISRSTKPVKYSYSLSLYDAKSDSLLGSQTFSHPQSRMTSGLRSHVFNHTQSSMTSGLRLRYPNPFCQTTKIVYSLTDICPVTLVFYNVQGEVIDTLVNEEQLPGVHSIDFNADSLATGIYFYKLSSCGISQTKKVFFK